MTLRNTKAARLERAGFVYIAGWLPAGDAAKVAALIEDNRERVEVAIATPGKRGRPWPAKASNGRAPA